MAPPRYSVGIDLGTTNSALAYAPLAGDAPPEILAVAQWESLAGLAEAPMLPSFLYLPEEAVAAQLRGRAEGAGEWVVGRFARRKAAETPGRVVHSAKSWLGHHLADRRAPFLPWGSEELTAAQKISPVRASALILAYLRGAWDARFAAEGAAFNDQEVTVTVPASFDAAAQRLTLDAAAEAGFPADVRLLEEPQAAFYYWLGRHDAARELWHALAVRSAGPWHVLVVDIGGGTSDFSLFALRPETRSGATDRIPEIHRVAVSEHILLGGDNIDLALAHFLEPRLTGERGRLSGAQWDFLVAASRDLKESVLARPGAPEESFAVALPGRGSSLIAGAQAATLTRAEIERLVLDGFFPACDAQARPYRTQGGLRELGLPYAADSAMTRHLADFLHGRPRVDAVLFNGGSLDPALLRARLRDQIGAWQAEAGPDGAAPLVLENDEPALAVARGAARAGALGRAQRIVAGAAQAVFLEVQGAADAAEPSLVCILPRGAQPGQSFEIADPALALRTGRLVRFQAFSSPRHGRARAGDILPWREGAFHALPPLETVVRTEEAGEQTIPVRLVATMNALGLLQIACVSTDPGRPQTWPLEFNLRPQEGGAAPPAPAAPAIGPNAGPEAAAAAQARIGAAFAGRGKPAAPALLKALEAILGQNRSAWNAPLLRALWPALEARMEARRLSVEHEESWIALAGFLLRPGFGVPGDPLRIDALWRVHEAGTCFPGKRVKAQEYLMWRRVAGGLSRERQEALLRAEAGRLRAGKAPPELVRLAGALELLPLETKTELIGRFTEQAVTLARARQHCAPWLAALGLLLNRTPLYAGPEAVVPPDLVERTWAALRGFDWADPELLEMQALFLRAARVTGDRSLDVPKGLRSQIAGKLEKAGVAPLRTAKIREFAPVGRSDRAGLFGESLPAGLVLGTGQDGTDDESAA